MIDLAAADSGLVSAVLHADTALTDTTLRYGVVVVELLNYIKVQTRIYLFTTPVL